MSKTANTLEWAVVVVALLIFVITPTCVFGADFYSEHFAPDHAHSPSYHGLDESRLERGDLKDSVLVITDHEPWDGHPAIVQGEGCGRSWSTTDNGDFGGDRRETHCNLNNHRTGEIRDGNAVWGENSMHN